MLKMGRHRAKMGRQQAKNDLQASYKNFYVNQLELVLDPLGVFLCLPSTYVLANQKNFSLNLHENFA